MRTPDWIEALDHALQADASPLALAFSGGLDSSVLLHALAQQPRARQRGLRALHVDHQMQAGSADWSRHCVEACAALRLPCVQLQVTVERGGSVEAAAREARYRALAAALDPGEMLVVAQHRNDQVETLLLRLLRGAGSAALAGMREYRWLAGHRLWRPLLEVPRAALEAYAQRHQLPWVEDPSNADLRLSRNFLRRRLLPEIRQHWPQAADIAIARSARLLREDAALIDQAAAQALASCRGLDPCSLRIEPLVALPEPMQRHVLRRWLGELGSTNTPTTILSRIRGELIDAEAGSTPALRWSGMALRRYRSLIHAQWRPCEAPDDWELPWSAQSALPLPAPFGRLEIAPAAAVSLPMRVRPRRGGEHITLPGRRAQSLKQVLQTLGVPVWERERLPLLFAADDGELLAAGDLAISGRLQALLRQHGAALRWHCADSD